MPTKINSKRTKKEDKLVGPYIICKNCGQIMVCKHKGMVMRLPDKAGYKCQDCKMEFSLAEAPMWVQAEEERKKKNGNPMA